MTLGMPGLRIGIAGCGRAARIHVERLLALPEIALVGCADPDRSSAENLATRIAASRQLDKIPSFDDHRELLKTLAPDALLIFTPHLSHYRIAMDALQAGCHIFVEKPLSTNLQEAIDIVGLARGRSLKVAVGHQFRLRPSLREARAMLEEGAIGSLRLVTATLAQNWLVIQAGAENSWRFDPKVAGGGILADAGDHLIDALLWTTGRVAREVLAIQCRTESGLDIVTAAAIRLIDGTPSSLSISGVTPGFLLELNYFGDRGRIRATDQTLEVVDEQGRGPRLVPVDAVEESIDSNFVAALTRGTPICCPGDQALDTVRLLEAVSRSAATGQVVQVI